MQLPNAPETNDSDLLDQPNEIRADAEDLLDAEQIARPKPGSKATENTRLAQIARRYGLRFAGIAAVIACAGGSLQFCPSEQEETVPVETVPQEPTGTVAWRTEKLPPERDCGKGRIYQRDEVLCANRAKMILDCGKNPPGTAALEVTCKDGQATRIVPFSCTKNDPLSVREGWKNIVDVIQGYEGMQTSPSTFCAKHEKGHFASGPIAPKLGQKL